MSREIVNSVLLLWGSLFCAVSSLYFWITKYYRTVKRDWIYRMQVSTSVLLFCDAMTNLFRGRPDLLGFWMVRISNFLNFFSRGTDAAVFSLLHLCNAPDAGRKRSPSSG